MQTSAPRWARTASVTFPSSTYSTTCVGVTSAYETKTARQDKGKGARVDGLESGRMPVVTSPALACAEILCAIPRMKMKAHTRKDDCRTRASKRVGVYFRGGRRLHACENDLLNHSVVKHASAAHTHTPTWIVGNIAAAEVEEPSHFIQGGHNEARLVGTFEGAAHIGQLVCG